jgi:hypothetical protein
MATKKAAKKGKVKAEPKKVAAEATADAKTLRASKPTPDDDAKVSAAAKRLRRSGEKKADTPVEVPKPPPVETPKPTPPTVVDTAHSITPAQAEQIAEVRVTHDDVRPPTKLDVPDVLSRAWDAVKGVSDPPLAECAPSHIDKFYFHGQRILAGGSPQPGDTLLARFEQKVFELMK